MEIKIPRNGRQLVITAIRSGNTSLLLLDHSGNQRQMAISVFARNPQHLIEELKELIGPAPKLAYRQLGARIYVDGAVNSEAELARINQILAMYPEQTISLVRVGTMIQPRTNIRLDLTVDQMVPSLHAAQTRGIARIRRQAHLMTTNGNSATYESWG